MSCENSGVRNILQSPRDEITLSAKIKMAPGPPWAKDRAGPWANGSLGLERPRFRMSLWEFGGSQSCIIMGTPEFSHTEFWVPEDTIWLEMGGSCDFKNVT